MPGMPQPITGQGVFSSLIHQLICFPIMFHCILLTTANNAHFDFYYFCPQLKASVEEEVNVHRSEIEKNAFKVFKLKQLVSCLILTLSIQEKDR